MSLRSWSAVLSALLALAGCGVDEHDEPHGTELPTTDPGLPDGVPTVYAFESRTGAGDSVDIAGQVFRQLLIDDLASHIGGLTARIDGGWFPVEGEVAGELSFYVDFDSSTSGAVAHGLSTEPGPLQVTYDDVSGGKNLVEKLAGNDAVGQHRDWSVDFVGWDHPEVTTPESLLRLWMAELDDRAVAWSNGQIPLDPTGQPVPGVHVTEEGHDLAQLTEKFLRGAIAFSQGADDYLDSDIEGKGLLADHTVVEDEELYTPLEHAWDEGFGYFGAARDLPSWSLDEIADVGAMDTDGDGAVDLHTEVCWGHATNAAKRDRGAVVATDLTAQAWEGFAGGRQLIAQADGPLTDAELDRLEAYRDQAVGAWEASIAATVVHYINDTLADQAALGTPAYSFADHAKHWSEMKGFALAFQFNPRSPLSDDEFVRLHGLLGTAPALDAEAASAYRADLLAARALIGSAYGFDTANLGDEDGQGGW